MDTGKRRKCTKRKNDDRRKETIECSACMSKQAFRMASGPPFCEPCIKEVQRLVSNGGAYVCSSISRRKDVIFAEPQQLASHLAKSLFVNKVYAEPNIVTSVDTSCNIGMKK